MENPAAPDDPTGDPAELEDIPDEIMRELGDDLDDPFDNLGAMTVDLQLLQELEKEENPEGEKNISRRRRRLGEHLPEEIAPLMRRANDEYFKGNFILAANLSRQAISEMPQAPEPYSLLALISEDSDSPDVALTFLVKAAQRSSDSSELWSECARLAVQLGRLSEAGGYLKKAARANRDDVTALTELYEMLNNNVNDNRSLIWTLTELAKRNPLDGKWAHELANYQYQSGQTLEALKTLRRSVEAQLAADVPVDLENANLLANAYLNEGMNDEVLMLDGQIAEAPADFRANAGIARIRQGELEIARGVLRPLSELDPAVFDEIFTTIAEELMRAQFFSDAADWILLMTARGLERREDLAHCLAAAGRVDEAVATLKELIIDLPALTTPPIALYQILKEADREEEALAWLVAHGSYGAQNDDMVLKRAQLAADSGDIDSFLSLAVPLLSRVLYDVYKLKFLRRESKVVERILGLTAPERMNSFMMKTLRYRRLCDGLFPGDEQQTYGMAIDCLDLLFKRKRTEEALVLGGLLVLSREKLPKKASFDVLFQFALVAFMVGDGAAACAVMRGVLLENNENELVWEFFNVFLQKTPEEEVSTHKFLLRALSKLPECVPLQIMLGNHSQSTVWFDHAITQYLNVLRDKPEEPIVSLLLAASYMSKAYVRTQRNPRKEVLCSYACIRKYSQVRMSDFPTEVNYNLGKFYQTLRMYPHAERMYRKVLDADVDYACLAVDADAHSQRYSMQRDAAFNLSLILRESNPNEARRVVRRFLTV
jgi:tetratricopeptide (TPR) repeat protein